MSHATTTVTPHCHLPGCLWNKTDLDDSVWRSGISSPVFSPPCHQNERDIFMDSIVTGLRLRRAEEAEKINSKVFSTECGSLGSPKVKMIWVFFFVCNIFSRKKALLHGCSEQMGEATNGSGTGHSVKLLPG
ncbi:unnamed protein product [Rangifer tarandus platyrhynchus]|uniref:Uncharacterized protein n=2 Tax=Rangifer tarandus platyrhynchus TaxID=3082113 RepID=A0ABN8Y5W4_RANTA|nr:unnamed protein product [Rangifer tarandus platyrhynchus]